MLFKMYFYTPGKRRWRMSNDVKFIRHNRHNDEHPKWMFNVSKMLWFGVLAGWVSLPGNWRGVWTPPRLEKGDPKLLVSQRESSVCEPQRGFNFLRKLWQPEQSAGSAIKPHLKGERNAKRLRDVNILLSLTQSGSVRIWSFYSLEKGTSF